MKIEIWSDVMCPFCYIGKRHLEKALEEFPEKEQVEIIWKSFQLNPNIPDQVQDNVYQYLAKAKGISYDESVSMHKRVEEMASNVGLDYHFEKAVVANSFKAHRVLQLAKRSNRGDELKEALLHAYFTEGKDISNEHVLIELAEQVGLTAADVELALTNEAFANYVNNDIEEARQIRVQGVPFFVFDRKYAVSGAQPVEHFKATLNQVLAEQQPAAPSGEADSCDVDGNC